MLPKNLILKYDGKQCVGADGLEGLSQELSYLFRFNNNWTIGQIALWNCRICFLVRFSGCLIQEDLLRNFTMEG